MAFRNNGYVRAAAHATITVLIAVVTWFLKSQGAEWPLLLAAVIFALFEVLRQRHLRVNSLFFRAFSIVLRPEEWWRPTGAAFVIWGATAAALCFPRNVAVLALGYLALGDAASSAIGNYLSRRKRSDVRLARSVGCLASCLVVGAFISYLGIHIGIYAALLGAVATMVVEAMSLPINDNLSIPVAAGLAMLLTGN